MKPSVPSTKKVAKTGRFTVRLVGRGSDGTIEQIHEQEIPHDHHNVALLLRRLPHRRLIARQLLRGGTVTIEERK